MRTIATITNEGFTCKITEDDDLRVSFTADMDIDADGANGQHGAKAAYRVDNKGSEALANGGMGLRNGKAVFTTSWGPDIAVSDAEGDPLVIDGVIITKTSYRFPGVPSRSPAAYVDSQTVPYIVVPPAIIRGVRGIVMGCKARVTYRGKSVDAVVADAGPRTKIGEASIAAAEAVDIPSSPRTGGLDGAQVLYELWPGVPAVVNGLTYALQRA